MFAGDENFNGLDSSASLVEPQRKKPTVDVIPIDFAVNYVCEQNHEVEEMVCGCIDDLLKTMNLNKDKFLETHAGLFAVEQEL